MGILARLRLAKIRTMARPNSPDMPPKRTKKLRLGIRIVQLLPSFGQLNRTHGLVSVCIFIDHDRIGIQLYSLY